MTKIKDALDVALKAAILICIVVALCNTIGARKDISEVTKELSSYKAFVSQPVENNSIECEGETCEYTE